MSPKCKRNDQIVLIKASIAAHCCRKAGRLTAMYNLGSTAEKIINIINKKIRTICWKRSG